MKQNFTKADLKNFMVVKVRNGWAYVVVDNLLIGKDGFLRLCDYNKDLTCRDYPHLFDIISVFDGSHHGFGCGFNTYIDRVIEDNVIIWERKEKKEIKLTTEERSFLNSILLVSDYKYIARDKSDELCVYKTKPERGCCGWGPNLVVPDYKRITDKTKDMFKFITWDDDEPYLIEDLLKGDIK